MQNYTLSVLSAKSINTHSARVYELGGNPVVIDPLGQQICCHKAGKIPPPP